MTPAVYFDLDGVLVDFVRGALKLHDKSIPVRDVRWDFWHQLGIPEHQFFGPMTREFWANLEPLEDGMRLLRMVEEMLPVHNVGLLTAPRANPDCEAGKREWVANHLPDYSDRLFIGHEKEVFAAPGKLLIDDHTENIWKFVKAGGFGVLVPRPWNVKYFDCDAYGDFKPEELVYEVRSLLAVATCGPVS